MKKNQKYVIGIDGGGTKTVVALANLDSRILKTAKSGSSNPRNVGIKRTVGNVVKGIKMILPKNKKAKILSIFIGLPAVEEELRPKIQEIQKELLTEKRISQAIRGKVVFGSDQLVAFKSGTDKKEGIVLIGGTGCVAHGWKGKREYKSSGWGWLADEGSAFWVGQKVLQAVLKDLDGRGPKTLLTGFVFGKFKIKKPEINLLNQKIYSQNFIEVVASLSSICNLAAKKGDQLAKDILIEAGNELALPVKAVVKKLNFPKDYNPPATSEVPAEGRRVVGGSESRPDKSRRAPKFPLVLVGGALKSNTILNMLKKEIKKVAPGAEFIIPKKEVVAGAVKLAIEELKK